MEILKAIAGSMKGFTRHRFFWLIVAVTACALIFSAGLTSVYHQFEMRLYDICFRIKPPVAQWDRLVFLDIDDSSLANAGEFPWPRNHYAEGLSVMKEAGLSTAIFDIQFMDPSPRIADRDAIARLNEKISRGGRLSAGDVSSAVIDNDALLVAGMREHGHVVIPYSFLKEDIFDAGSPEMKSREAAMKLFVRKASIPVPDGRAEEFADCVVPDRRTIQIPITGIIENAGNFGYVDSEADIDGVYRKVRMIRVFNGRIYFSLAMSVVMELCGVPKNKVIIEPGRRIVLPHAIHPVTFERKDIIIPVNSRCEVYINWAGGFLESFRHDSFYELLEYDALKDDIHQLLDALEIESKSTRRTELFGERSALSGQFDTESDPAKKRDLRDRLSAIDRGIDAIEEGYVTRMMNEVDALKKANDPAEREEIADRENLLSAVKLVRRVDRLRGMTGVIGLTAVGTQDLGITSLENDYPMVGSYPNVINTVLQGEFISRPPVWVNFALVVILAFGLSFIIMRLHARMSLFVLISSFVAVNTAVIALFAASNIWMDQLGLNLSVMLPSLVIIGVKFLSEESQKRFIKQAFGYYLSKQVIDEIIKNPESLHLGGEEREITIFFSDIQGFTSISEKLTPSQLVELLNEYLSAMTDIVLSHNGTVDKFIGDAIMAFYGAPQYLPMHAKEACTAAIEMQNLLREMRKRWKRRGIDEIFARCGINTGPAVIGNMGSRNKMNYTVMGDSVNLASRLEGANKYYHTYTMISESTYAKVKDDVEVRYLDRIRVVGKEQPIEIFELIALKGGLSAAQKELLGIYAEGVALFRDREWEKARHQFRTALKVNRNDGPSSAYVERCTEFMKKPPSKKWDGVYKLSAK